MKRLLVELTVDTGERVSTSVRVEDGSLTSQHIDTLKSNIGKKIAPHFDNALYCRVRYTEKVGKLKGKTKSVKVYKIDQLEQVISSISNDLGIQHEQDV